jgi:hypothetical protein
MRLHVDSLFNVIQKADGIFSQPGEAAQHAPEIF